MVDGFIDAGGNLIDTADMYAGGESEVILGKSLKGKDLTKLVIASKCWFPTDDSPNGRGLSRKHIVEACEVKPLSAWTSSASTCTSSTAPTLTRRLKSRCVRWMI